MLLTRMAVGVLLALVQFAAALPWLALLDPRAAKTWLRRPAFWAYALGGVVAAGVVLELVLTSVRAREGLDYLGRFYGSVLHLQLVADLLVAVFAVLLLAWPK